jgi:hypothetical protein
MRKYAVTTKTETIVISVKDEKNLETKLNFIASFAEIISVERIIATV